MPPPSTCGPNEFSCNDGLCIDVRRRCDGYRDCQDSSDESNCGMYAGDVMGGQHSQFSFILLYFYIGAHVNSVNNVQSVCDVH